MNILIACEESGTVRDAFIKKGHNAISCDILETSSPGPHIIGDVENILQMKWGLIIAHPPCTYLANSGVCHLKKLDRIDGKGQYHSHNGERFNLERYVKMVKAVRFFEKIQKSNCDKICIENPIPHKYGIGKTYQQIIQPWQFGHTERKATCLWLKGLPKLIETNNVKEEMLKLPKREQQRLHYLSPGPNRAKLRSKTYQGIADALADQYTSFYKSGLTVAEWESLNDK